jgi:predicted AlkP superfamily phosphohydrolase/phosphomutase
MSDLEVQVQRIWDRIQKMDKKIDGLIHTLVPMTEPEEPEDDWLTGTVTPEMRRKIVEEQRKMHESSLMRSSGGVPKT